MGARRRGLTTFGTLPRGSAAVRVSGAEDDDRRPDLDGRGSDLDVVALTSRNEGTPLSLIEAMAAGKAVVATDVGGVGDLLQREWFGGVEDRTTC